MKIFLSKILLSLFICSIFLISACEKKEKTQNPSTKQQESRPLNSDTTNKNKQGDGNRQDARMKSLENIEIDLSDSKTFLMMNSQKPDVTTTDSGLQYRVIKQGSGSKPEIDNTVQVHYRGTFPNGQEFDSSHKRGKAAEFKVNKVIAGWTEALLLMNEGSTYELVIPPELAYGDRGAGNTIPPKQVLKFEVELIKAQID